MDNRLDSFDIEFTIIGATIAVITIIFVFIGFFTDPGFLPPSNLDVPPENERERPNGSTFCGM